MRRTAHVRGVEGECDWTAGSRTGPARGLDAGARPRRTPTRRAQDPAAPGRCRDRRESRRQERSVHRDAHRTCRGEGATSLRRGGHRSTRRYCSREQLRHLAPPCTTTFCVSSSTLRRATCSRAVSTVRSGGNTCRPRPRPTLDNRRQDFKCDPDLCPFDDTLARHPAGLRGSAFGSSVGSRLPGTVPGYDPTTQRSSRTFCADLLVSSPLTATHRTALAAVQSSPLDGPPNPALLRICVYALCGLR